MSGINLKVKVVLVVRHNSHHRKSDLTTNRMITTHEQISLPQLVTFLLSQSLLETFHFTVIVLHYILPLSILCQKANSYNNCLAKLSCLFLYQTSHNAMPLHQLHTQVGNTFDFIGSSRQVSQCCLFSMPYCLQWRIHTLSGPFKMRLDDVGRASWTGGHSGNSVGWRGWLRKGLG